MISEYWQRLWRQLEPSLAPALRWYHQREEREQLALQVLGIAFALVLIWLLLWRPVVSGFEDAQNRYERQQQVLMWMRDNAEAIRATRRDQDSAAGESLGDGDWINVINATASEENISLSGFTPEGDSAVRISLEREEFASVMGWLQRLEADYGVHATTVDLSAGREAGTVDLRATLRRSS